MYGGFDVFRVYMAVKLHFTTNYNYFDYDGKVNIKLDTFTKRNDRYFFINSQLNIIRMKYLISLLQILLRKIKTGLGTY